MAVKEACTSPSSYSIFLRRQPRVGLHPGRGSSLHGGHTSSALAPEMSVCSSGCTDAGGAPSQARTGAHPPSKTECYPCLCSAGGKQVQSGKERAGDLNGSPSTTGLPEPEGHRSPRNSQKAKRQSICLFSSPGWGRPVQGHLWSPAGQCRSWASPPALVHQAPSSTMDRGGRWAGGQGPAAGGGGGGGVRGKGPGHCS